jgi:glycosyltransferase involved in cell wall biosynthesis
MAANSSADPLSPPRSHTAGPPRGVATLIATRHREDLLVAQAVPSALGQTLSPALIVVVDDGEGLGESTQRTLHQLAAEHGVELILLDNERTPGAGGAWNTGLAHLSSRGHRGFVAILDDDDTWDESHLETNLRAASSASIVVSGLRLRIDGQVVPRPLVPQLDDRDFLVGNPGWQGSNTFVDLELLLNVGGFREGLQSLNDRDIAIRLLRHPDAVWRLTGRWTATWNADTPGNLSTPRSAVRERPMSSGPGQPNSSGPGRPKWSRSGQPN